MNNWEYNGQSKSEYEKNHKRIIDIINKTSDIESQERLATTQANRIKDEYKAINRAIVSKELGYEHLFDIFLKRAYELGNVGKQEYRDYQLSKLGI